MSIIKMLHNLLKESLPHLHAARRHALMAAVKAGLSGASLSIYSARAGGFGTGVYQA